MKHRSLGKMFALFVVTLGIYRLVWLVKTRNEMVAKGQKIPGAWLLFLPFFMVIVVAFWMVISTVSAPDPDAVPIAPLIAFYVVILGFGPLTLLWFWSYAKAVEKITLEKISFPLAIIAFLLIPDGIDMLVVQDGFNKIPEQPVPVDTAPAPPAPLQV